MIETDLIPARLEAFGRDKGGGGAFRSRGGYTLVLIRFSTKSS